MTIFRYGDGLLIFSCFDDLITPVEASKNLKMSSDVIRQLLRDKRLAGYFRAGRWWIDPADLDEYLSETGFRDRDEFYRLLENHYLTTLAIEGEKQ